VAVERVETAEGSCSLLLMLGLGNVYSSRGAGGSPLLRPGSFAQPQGSYFLSCYFDGHCYSLIGHLNQETAGLATIILICQTRRWKSQGRAHSSYYLYFFEMTWLSTEGGRVSTTTALFMNHCSRPAPASFWSETLAIEERRAGATRAGSGFILTRSLSRFDSDTVQTTHAASENSAKGGCGTGSDGLFFSGLPLLCNAVDS